MPSTPGTSSPAGTITGFLLPTQTLTQSGNSHVGAIAGGILGGIAGLGLLVGLAVFFFLRRRRSHTAPSAAYSSLFDVDRYPSPQPPSQGYSRYGKSQYRGSTSDLASVTAVPRFYVSSIYCYCVMQLVSYNERYFRTQRILPRILKHLALLQLIPTTHWRTKSRITEDIRHHRRRLEHITAYLRYEIIYMDQYKFKLSTTIGQIYWALWHTPHIDIFIKGK
jgi:hypothetical protein